MPGNEQRRPVEGAGAVSTPQSESLTSDNTPDQGTVCWLACSGRTDCPLCIGSVAP